MSSDAKSNGATAMVLILMTPSDAIGFETKTYGDFGGVFRKETLSIKTTGFADIGTAHIGNKK